MLHPTLDMLRSLRDGSPLKIKRSIDDFVADRIVMAGSAPTLLDFMEGFAKALDSDIGFVGGARLAAFMAAAHAPEAPAILAWLRQHPRIAAMLCSLRNEDDYRESIASIALPPVSAGPLDYIQARPAFDIGIRAELLSPLAHGADTKAGNATLFRRCKALTRSGREWDLPYYAGNALRGQLRDLLADHLLRSLGLVPRRDQPPVSLWFFHALYSGGVLAEQSKIMEAVNKELGKGGSLRTDGVRFVRDHLPTFSLLGGALGNKILSGRLYVNDLRPHCLEWGLGEKPAAELMEWNFLTRHDNYEGRHAEDGHEGMIATTETLKLGTVLSGGIDIDTHGGDLERAALGCGLALLQRRGYLGAGNRLGFGKCRIELTGAPDPAPYEAWLAENKDRLLTFLDNLGALTPPDYAAPAEAPAEPKPRKGKAKDPVAEPAGAPFDDTELLNAPD
jgi:hypothetical protein